MLQFYSVNRFVDKLITTIFINNLPEPTKEGMCPFISPKVCNSSSTDGSYYKGCTSDQDCEHSMKCCSAGGDCTICADPLFKEDLRKANKMKTSKQ